MLRWKLAMGLLRQVSSRYCLERNLKKQSRFTHTEVQYEPETR